MARRIVTPFAVEIRKAGQRVKTKPVSAGFFTLPKTEQPPVTGWPGMAQEPVASPQTAEAIKPPVSVMSGRVLPALDVPVKRVAVPAPEPAQEPGKPEPIDVAGPEASEEVESEVPVAVPQLDFRTKVAATPPFRQGRTKLPRDAFRREERWKARLPVAVHRTQKRGA